MEDYYSLMCLCACARAVFLFIFSRPWEGRSDVFSFRNYTDRNFFLRLSVDDIVNLKDLVYFPYNNVAPYEAVRF